MAQWLATIGELDRSYDIVASTFVGAAIHAEDWVTREGGRITDEHVYERKELERYERIIKMPYTKSTIRPWPLRLFKRWRVKRRRVTVETTLSLSVVHDEMNEAERLAFCKSVGL